MHPDHTQLLFRIMEEMLEVMTLWELMGLAGTGLGLCGCVPEDAEAAVH